MQPDETSWPAILTTLISGEDLSSDDAAWAMARIMDGEASPAQFGAFVATLRAKGESVDEIVGLVQSMRERAQKIELPFEVVDTCGTGGDRAGTLNVSTMGALVAAGAGAKVAKHGNRAASSRCGSADLLEALGVKIDLGPQAVAACIEEAGIGFCFAPIFHPSMRHAAPPRRELGIPTVFNFLGPLTNPAGAKYQALGVSDPDMAPKMVEVLRRLGSVHALVFHGSDGLDEISTVSQTDVWELKNGEVNQSVLDPLDHGIPRARIDDLRGGDAAHNADATIKLLSGAKGPARDIVLVNASAALVAADMEVDFTAALARCADAIDSGAAQIALDRMIEISNDLGGEV